MEDIPTSRDSNTPEPAADDFSRRLKASNEQALKKLQAEIDEADERERRGHANSPPRPAKRTTPIAIRFDEFTIKRLKELAGRRNTGYQTLLKDFVVERLYEEEKRERIIE
jgi:predicted DNA binding CopG/RHH family protein